MSGDKDKDDKYSRLIYYKGKSQTLIEWSKELKIKYSTLQWRVDFNYPVDRLFSQYPEVVLGLDVSSTSTGWAVLKNGRFYKRENIDYGWIRPHRGYGLLDKLDYFAFELDRVLNIVEPLTVGIEDVFLSRNVKTLKVLSRFSGAAIQTVYDYREKAGPYIIQVKESRARWGTQNKEEVFEAVRSKYGKSDWTFKRHNDITDAISIALYARDLSRSYFG